MVYTVGLSILGTLIGCSKGLLPAGDDPEHARLTQRMTMGAPVAMCLFSRHATRNRINVSAVNFVALVLK